MTSFNTILKKIQEPRWFSAAVALLGAYFLIPTFYDSGVWPLPADAPIWGSIDPSWKLGLSYAKASDVDWGRDLVFTYGPLAFLTTRISLGAGKYSLLLYDFFLTLNFFFAFYLSLLKSEHRALSLFVIFTIVLLVPVYLGSGNPVLLMMFLVFWIRQAVDQPSHISFAMQALIVALLFFMKFNTSLVCLVLLSISFLYHLVFNKPQRLKAAGYYALSFLLIGVGCMSFKVSLLPYVKGGLDLVKGYNDIMYLDEGYKYELGFAVFSLALCGIILIWRAFLLKEQRVRQLLMLTIFALSGYVLYKQAFTRCDIQHISEFYIYFPFLVLSLSDFHFSRDNRYSGMAVTAVLFICIFYAKKREDRFFQEYGMRLTKPDYYSRLKNQTDSSSIFLYPNNNQVPDRIRQKIGNTPTDVFPWNVHMLIENRIRYAQRPVFQSYTAYNRALGNLNLEFYNSERAPGFVLYENLGIDGRYPFFDEPKLQAHYLQNYHCADTFTYNNRLVMLLEQKPGRKKLTLSKSQEYEMSFDDEIFPKEGCFYEIYAEKSFTGKLASLVHHTPTLLLQIQTADSNWWEFRTSTNLLESGVFSEYFCNSTSDVYQLMNGDSIPAGRKVKTYGLRALTPAAYKKKIKVIEYRLISS